MVRYYQRYFLACLWTKCSHENEAAKMVDTLSKSPPYSQPHSHALSYNLPCCIQVSCSLSLYEFSSRAFTPSLVE